MHFRPLSCFLIYCRSLSCFLNIYINQPKNCWICDIYLIDILHHGVKRMRKHILVCSKECEIIAEEELFGVP